MTDDQWQIEYLLQLERERVEKEYVGNIVAQVVLGLREMMVSLLGLNITAKAGEGTEVEIGDYKMQMSKFIPAALLWGNPELLSAAFKSRDDEGKVHDAINDPEFEAFSQALMNDEGDMDPVILGPQDEAAIKRERWFSVYNQQMLKNLGVKERPKGGSSWTEVDQPAPVSVPERRRMKFNLQKP